jgi:predicted O-linked N-acetylglucosamine transferase (SPINDLY family)
LTLAQALGLAAAAYQRHDLAEAERLCLRVIGADPANLDALQLAGAIAFRAGRPDAAAERFARAAAAHPASAEAHFHLGNALRALGRQGEAVASYDRCIALSPGFADAHNNRGNAFCDLGRPAQALASFDSALRCSPGHGAAHANRGNALLAMGRPAEALASYDAALSIDPANPATQSGRGNALRALGRLDEALACYDGALELAPAHGEALVNRGIVLQELGRHAQALDCYERALRLAPGSAEALSNRGNALQRLGRAGEALESCERALRAKPQFAEAHCNRGDALNALKRFDEAVAAYDRALQLRPGFPEAHNGRGIALHALLRYAEALASYERAIALRPGFADAHNNRAYALREAGRYEDAALAFAQVLRLAPDYPFAKGGLLHTKMLCCDWSGFDELCESVNADVRAGRRSAEPFGYQAVSESPRDLRDCAAMYAAERFPQRHDLPAPAAWPRGPKIRVGYLCGEFRSQATSILATGLFELHDRDRFDIFAFDNGWDDGSQWRRRQERAFGTITDIARLGDLEAARLVRDRQIDVLVNLNGYFGHGRQGVFSLRPSPVQVSFLGFPGTLGAPYMDYIVADSTVIPEQDREFYAEKVAYLPHCYQVNDSRRGIAGAAFTRRDEGLPEAGFVYCCFNNNYKIVPAVFDGWMRILRRVEGSVLWLYENRPGTAESLRRNARARGVDPDRLVFAAHLPHAEHLARLRCADLVVDTLPYNAHTTASDALWAGVPVLTRIGRTFPGRVAASLLEAIGLPELIAKTPEEYEALAVGLASSPARLAGLRDRLAANRLARPLYDTALFARHLEAAFTMMVERQRSGLEPCHLVVPP